MSCFDNKRYVVDDGIRTLTYFHEDRVTGCKEIKKDYDKKDSDKNVVIIDEIVTIEKNGNN